MNQHPSRRTLLGLLAAGVAAPVLAVAPRAAAPVAMYRGPGCGCCLAWVPQAEKALGRKIAVQDRTDLLQLKARLGVPEQLMSCHTAVIDGLVVEGHVPPADIVRALRSRSKGVRGIAVPGMPMGAPGMEHGGHVERYQVIAFGPAGTRVFATHG